MDKLSPKQWADQGLHLKDSSGDSPSRFPRSICSASREEDELSSQSDKNDDDPKWSQNTEIWIFDARKLNYDPLL